MDNNFSHWYPIREETQLDFDNRPHVHEILCEGHIEHGGRLMCGESKEVLMNRAGAKKQKMTVKREVTPKMCPVCLEAWRNHPDSAYYRFTHGTPVRVTVKEVSVIGAQA